MKTDKSIQAFFGLLRVGLWEQADVNLNHGLLETFGTSGQGRANDKVDWEEVYQLAEEQSVVGLVLAGIEHSYVKPSQDLLLQWIGEVQIIEQQNKAMNEFIAKLIEKLRKEDVYAILVKGQGIAQCYKKPLWRTSGDVDLLLSNINYQKALKILKPIAIDIEEENTFTHHIGMKIDKWEVELHGSLRCELWTRLYEMLDDVQQEIFCGGSVRSWQNGKTQIFLPRADEDVFYVFAHILQHFFKEGIGLRQVCDWCQLLNEYRDALNIKLLESRIEKAGIITEWKSFASFAVHYLGMPIECMPLYDDSKKWQKKATRIMRIIIETGNFGHNKDFSYKYESSILKRKTKTFLQITSDSFRQVFIFPIDTVKVWFIMMGLGIRSLFRKGRKGF